MNLSENQEMAVAILHNHSCLTAMEIKGFIYRKFNVNISPNSVSGSLRSLVSKGMIGKSNTTGKTVYWLTKEAL